jgi:GntR family transcriptional regulator
MFKVGVDRSDQTALHVQVAAEIRRAIADGEAAPGDRLPPAKDFATVIGVNTHTVLRAFHQLRDEGILEFQRGRGITVAGAPMKGLVRAHATEFIRFAYAQGFKRDELVQLVEQLA